jgi:hypothetical protein
MMHLALLPAWDLESVIAKVINEPAKAADWFVNR